VEGLPEFTVEEIAAHNSYSAKAAKGGKPNSVWVQYKAGVYDITEFIMKHPGGDKRIMLAAGGSIEKFWNIYTQHQDDAVRTILEGYRIGNVKGYVAASAASMSTEELWKNEPKRAAGLEVLNQRPFNAQTPEAILDQFLTPNELFFVRNHMPVPDIRVDDKKSNFCLQIDGEGLVPHCFSIRELMESFPQHTVTTTIQCGGNRRMELETAKETADCGSKEKPKAVKGLSWTGGGIGTAQWTGVYLKDVVESCRLERATGSSDPDAPYNDKYHVHLFGADNDAAGQFSVSVPYELAMDPKREVLVAWQMNGEPIPRDHGYPLRAVVPGTVGVRNCKWLNRVSVQPDEAQTVWQQGDYKNFPSWFERPDASLPSVMSMPVQSKVTSATFDSSNEEVTVKGYAYCGGGTGIQRVELSVDGGRNFITLAHLLDDNGQRLPKPTRSRQQKQQWAWTQWEARIDVSKFKPEFPVQTDAPIEGENPVEENTFRVCSKAVTVDNQSQPPKGSYNFRGLLYNSYSCRDASIE
jgi:sulfite oxidase